MTTPAKKLFSFAVKAIIVVVAFGFIYHKVSNNADLAQFRHLILPVKKSSVVITLTAVIVLMLANWLLEALKWKYLTRVLAPISIYTAVESVFCGLTLAIFTPNRLGEYGGRVMFLPPRKRVHGVFSMAVGSFAQMVITNVLGTIAILWFGYRFLHPPIWLYLAAIIVGAVIVTLFLVFYFNVGWLVTMLNNIPFLKKYHRFFGIMNRYHSHELGNIMLYSLARFAVFTFQYYLVLHLLIPQLATFPMLMMVLILFFIQSILPSLDLLDVGVRGLTAGFFFHFVTGQSIAVIAAVSSIWFINLIVPAIIGSVFVFKLKLF
ncbi:hypothetical protein [Mucilaginibacter ginkgonis]|uniref:Lysylphosphatidylglycerol synthase-like protein n=1 Tax=Mucilaginibacter ginkgonis TaxID=2682091 RepID=A0A6I4HZ83_9SPHI|nr:hypothetical protein [Mucilaginibacter ginkgonis]QQL49404.1 hypothetical protein GO620_014700 [Mucilaginibacter ginkgonis]